MRASYREAISWIVTNDDVDWLDDKNGIPSVTACLVADLFGVHEAKVCRDLRKRLKEWPLHTDRAARFLTAEEGE